MIEQIIKRDGRTAPFELDKIANAIFGAAQSVVDGGKVADVLSNAPKAADGFFAVPKVVV